MNTTRCAECARYFGLRKCEAFLQEIPEEIYLGSFDHIKPHPDDGGLQFEPDKDKPKANP